MGQDGHLFKLHGAWYLRFYQDRLRQDGSVKRVRVAERLCSERDEKGIPLTKTKIKSMAQERMSQVNEQEESKKLPPEQMTVRAFYENFYLPYMDQELRPSTVNSYKQIWSQHLKGHFGESTLSEYSSAQAFDFLMRLKTKLGRRTLLHVKNLGSAIFSYAKDSGRIDSNPWEVNTRRITRGMELAPMKSYSLEEIENIISALVDRVDCQLAMALGFFLGLRTSEVFGLRWEDFSQTGIHIRRAFVRGIIGKTKTPESVATLPLVDERVLVPLALWRERCGNPSEGYVFLNERGNPTNARDLARRIIIPTLSAKGIEWKGYYAGRRGAGTTLISLDGEKGAIAAQGLLRHKSLATTLAYYKDKTPEVTAEGLRLLAQTSSNGNGRPAPAPVVPARVLQTGESK